MLIQLYELLMIEKWYLASREQHRKHNTGKMGLNRAKPLIEQAITRNPTQTTRWSNGAFKVKDQKNSKRNLLHTKPINQTTKNPIQDTQTKMENKQKRENPHPRGSKREKLNRRPLPRKEPQRNPERSTKHKKTYRQTHEPSNIHQNQATNQPQKTQ